MSQEPRRVASPSLGRRVSSGMFGMNIAYSLLKAVRRPAGREELSLHHIREEIEMNADILQGKWKQLRGDVKKWWGNLTDDDLDKIAGERDKLIGRVQERRDPCCGRFL